MPNHKLDPEAEDLFIRPVRQAGERNLRESRLWTILSAIAGFVGVVVILLVVSSWLDARKQDQQDTQIARNNQRIDALYTVGKQWELAAKRAGGTSGAPSVDEAAKDPSVVADPVQAPGPVTVPGRTGEAGPRGPAPSASEVAQAVASYCAARDGCRGPGGAVGPPVTPDQVAAAVTTYCNAQGLCKGPVGPAGVQGIPGKDGEDGQGIEGPAGPQGPPPSDEQVTVAVAGFCTQETQPCRGPAGPTGEPGPRGIGITQITCEGDDADSYWRITYSDGDIRTAVGPCRIGPAPQPEPTE